MVANLLLLSSVLLITMGQILIKFGINELAIDKGGMSLVNTLFVAFGSIKIIMGIFLAGMASIAWVLLLTKIELSYAYPFMMMPIVLVSILSLFFFNESIDLTQWLGIAFIIIGFWFFSK